MAKFIMMVGIPGSGKSTVAKELSIKYNAKIFSSDEYREKLFGNERDQSNNELVFKTLYEDLKRELVNNKNCIFDATNVSRNDRKYCLDYISTIPIPNFYKIAYVMNTPIDECIYRDAHRDRTVGKYVINKMVGKFEYPQKFEGFNLIKLHNVPFYDSKIGVTKLIKLFSTMASFNQNNPHHKYDLFNHTIKLAENYNYNTPQSVASIFHDVGKLYTRTTDDKGISHYFNHANYSTYWIITNLDILSTSSRKYFADMIFYVNYHMKIRDIVKSKKVNYYKNLFGENRYNELVKFMNFDNIACGTDSEVINIEQ